MSELAHKLNEIEESSGVTKVNLLNALAYSLHTSDAEKTKEFAQEALILSNELNYARGIAESNKNLGIYFVVFGDSTKAEEFCRTALKEYSKLNDLSGKANILNILGVIERDKGNLKECINFHYKSLEIREKLGDKKAIGQVLDNIGNSYHSLEDYDNALEYHKKATELFEEIGYKQGLGASYNNIANCYDNSNDSVNAIKYYFKAVKCLEDLDNKQYLANVLQNIGNIYLQDEEYDDAYENYINAFELRKKLKDRQGMGMSCIALSNYHEKLGDKKEAIKFLLRGLDLSSGNFEIQMKVLEYLSTLYEKIGDLETSNHYLKKFAKIQKEFFIKTREERVLELKSKFETEKKEKENEIYRLRNIELVDSNNKLDKALKELKAAQEKLIESEKLKVFVATTVTANHELNQPLAIIKGNLDLVKMLNKEEKLEKFIHKASEATFRCSEILDKLNKIKKPKLTNYAGSVKMVDLQSDNNES